MLQSNNHELNIAYLASEIAALAVVITVDTKKALNSGVGISISSRLMHTYSRTEGGLSVPFIVFCAIIAFVIQLVVLYNVRKHRRTFCHLSLVGMELIPATLAAHAFLTKRPDGILGWEFTMAISGWIAGAILLGYLLAWGVFAYKSKQH